MISIIIRGPIVPSTSILIQHLYLYFQNPEIILSTWKTEEGKYKSEVWPTKVVFSEDPGNIENGNNSVNRVVVGIVEGLKQASYNLVVELRSDLMIHNLNWLHLYQNYWDKPRKGSWNLFRNRMLISNIYSVNPASEWKLPLHPGDWFHMGLKEDLMLLFDIPHRDATLKIFRNEQYFLTEAMKKKGMSIPFQYDEDVSSENIQITKEFFRDNFVIADVPNDGIWNTKYPVACGHHQLFNHQDWLALFNE